MRHQKKKLQLNRYTSWRKATIASLARSLFFHQSIKTTLKKAYAVKPLVERLISLGKNNTLTAKRRAYQVLNDHKLVNLLFNEIAPRFANRVGGYTRIMHADIRRGDSAELAVIELVEIKKKEVVSKIETKPQISKEKVPEDKKPKATETAVKEKPPITKKPTKKFLGGLRSIFKKERDAL